MICIYCNKEMALDNTYNWLFKCYSCDISISDSNEIHFYFKNALVKNKDQSFLYPNLMIKKYMNSHFISFSPAVNTFKHLFYCDVFSGLSLDDARDLLKKHSNLLLLK